MNLVVSNPRRKRRTAKQIAATKRMRAARARSVRGTKKRTRRRTTRSPSMRRRRTRRRTTATRRRAPTRRRRTTSGVGRAKSRAGGFALIPDIRTVGWASAGYVGTALIPARLTFLPSGMRTGAGSLVTTGATAVILGGVVSKFAGRSAGVAVATGGLVHLGAQVISLALSKAGLKGTYIPIGGLGTYVPIGDADYDELGVGDDDDGDLLLPLNGQDMDTENSYGYVMADAG